MELRRDDRLAAELAGAAACIRDHDEFLVAAHREPDGDAAGSTLALGTLLEQLGKDVVRFNVDGVPRNLQFLEGAEGLVQELPRDFDPEVTVLLDCSSPDRVGEVDRERLIGDELLVIDHHDTFEGGEADLQLHDPDAAATGELIYRLVRELGASLTEEIAEALYCAIMTDTGSFQYSNTNRTTFRIAGELLEAGVDAWEMTVQVLESQPLERIRLLSRVLDTLELSSCGRLAFIEIGWAMLEDADRPAELIDGFINYGRSIRGVEVSTQFREREDGSWKVSFRSKGRVDVGEIARRFGGGGHVNAAGFESEKSATALRVELEETLIDLVD